MLWTTQAGNDKTAPRSVDHGTVELLTIPLRLMQQADSKERDDNGEAKVNFSDVSHGRQISPKFPRGSRFKGAGPPGL